LERIDGDLRQYRNRRLDGQQDLHFNLYGSGWLGIGFGYGDGNRNAGADADTDTDAEADSDTDRASGLWWQYDFLSNT
jgi:hypothetical protein